MFRTISRLFLPNPLDWMLRRTAKKGGTRILIAWNRGLGDIALGLYAIVHRIREKIPNANIAVLTRENLCDGFSMLQDIEIIPAPNWKRGEPYSVKDTLSSIGMDADQFDLILEKPSPTDWVRWQRGSLTPRLHWNPMHDALWKKILPEFSLDFTYIGVQPVAETQYGLWRNWTYERWNQLFDRLERLDRVKVLLFGYGSEPKFSHPNLIDLRGKTNLFELLSVVKNCCRAMILPDSGILSMVYYLDVNFPIQVVSLWADSNHGILKQNVASPNQQLVHTPMIGERRDLRSVSAQDVLHRIFPAEPLKDCPKAADTLLGRTGKVGVIILAGGIGSRLGFSGPKGLFSIHGKPLFQWICEKIPKEVPIAIMTSPLNHEATVVFFEQMLRFGRDIHFFQQDSLSLLDEQKQPLGIFAPDGNGSVFKAFAESGLSALFEQKGIDWISIVPVDNILADPMDSSFFSYMNSENADVAIKCIQEEEADPSMGALVERCGRLEVIEYTEINSLSSYPYRYAGMMGVKFSFMKQMAQQELPLHWVWKQTGGKFSWKGERFLFDVLPLARSARALCYPRSQIYAPLKTMESLDQIRLPIQ